MKTYALLLQATLEMHRAESSVEEQAERRAEWSAWTEELEAAGHLAGGLQLSDDGRRLSASSDSSLVDEPDDAWLLGGYFLVRAESLEQATELAKSCPLLRAGGRVEVRPAADT